MALFLSANIHQGDDLFGSRGKHCAFITLSTLVTAQNIPLSQWSKTTIDNILVQGDRMYLKALNKGFIIQDQNDEFLSIDKLPKLVSVSICGNNTSMIATISNSSELPYVIESIEARNNSVLPVMGAQNNSDQPVMVAQNNSDLPVVIQPSEPDDEKNRNQIWVINYGKGLQGPVTTDQEIESHYSDIHTALLNTFLNDNYAILILDGYMMAIVKQSNYFYLFDSHARDFNGMPNPNGTAVVMKFINTLELEQYLYYLSIKLHANLYEIVAVQVNKSTTAKQILSNCTKDQEYQKNFSMENKGDKQAGLQKESQKGNECKKRKKANETDLQNQNRLERDRLYKKQKRSEETDYEKQYWAKANINKFHKSVQYTISQCIVCQEAWPLKSNDNATADLGPLTQNPSEDIVYNNSTEMSSFLPVGEQQEQELEAVRNQLSSNDPMARPSVENEPLNILYHILLLWLFQLYFLMEKVTLLIKDL